MGAGGRGGQRRGPVTVTVAVVVLVALLGAGSAWAASNDPYRDQQWGLDRIRVDEAWTSTRGEGAVVAIVDTGISLSHPDLFDRISKRPDGSVIGIDLVDDDLDPSDEHGHGTLVAGIVAAATDNGVGIAGVAPAAKLLPVRVLGADGSGDSETVGRGVIWAVDNGADVVNVSLESVAPKDGERAVPGVPNAAVRYAAERGVLVVAAAGNRPGSAAGYPADSPIVLVGASDRADRRAPFSTVDRHDGLVAPGVDVVSTWCRRFAGGCDPAASPYGVAEGTSFAAPHVSGVAALLFARGHDAGEVRQRLLDGAVDVGPPGPDLEHGAGRLDAAASLTAGSVRTTSAPRPTPEPVPESAPAAEPRAPAEPAPAPAPTTPAPAPGDDAAAQTLDPDVTGVAGTPGDDPGGDGDADEVVPAPHLVGAPVGVPTEPAPTALVRDDGVPVAIGTPSDVGGVGTRTYLEVLAALLVIAAMACWSSVARREV